MSSLHKHIVWCQDLHSALIAIFLLYPYILLFLWASLFFNDINIAEVETNTGQKISYMCIFSLLLILYSLLSSLQHYKTYSLTTGCCVLLDSFCEWYFQQTSHWLFSLSNFSHIYISGNLMSTNDIGVYLFPNIQSFDVIKIMSPWKIEENIVP